jgi:type IV pilus assembly protein PilY1
MKCIQLRTGWAFVASLLLVLVSANTRGAPAQSPLFISGTTVAGKPNIMLMVDTSGSMRNRVAANNDTRINIAKTAAKNMVDQLTPAEGAQPTVRLGLSTYNNDNGGKMVFPLSDLDATQASSIKSKINTFTASGVTPLATTLSDIGYYFATGNATDNLTLHPGKSNQQVLGISTLFARSDGRDSGLLGFDPALVQSCTVTTVGVTPADMPAGWTPQCACDSDQYVTGGAATEGAASDTAAVPPIQMLVIRNQPTICTDQEPPACANQINYGMCSSDLPDCPSCTNTTDSGENEGLLFSPATLPSVIDVGNSSVIYVTEDPNVYGQYPSLDLVSGMSSICSLTTRRVTLDNQYYNEGTVTGVGDGTCRICASLNETTSTSCSWMGSGSCSHDGDQQCANWSHSGCQTTNDSWTEWNYQGCSVDDQTICTNWDPYRCNHRVGNICTNWDAGHCNHTATCQSTTGSCLCMNHGGCVNAGDTWTAWNHAGSDDRGYSCDTEGHNWCANWSHYYHYCRDWGVDCHRTTGTCSTITPPTCSCSTQTYTKCAVATPPLDITIGTGGGSTGGGGSNNGGTGGTLGEGNLCFDPSKYYTVQYNGSPDIVGPYRGDQLNWYFQEHTGFTEGSLELPNVVSEENCVTTNAPIQNYCQKSFVVVVSDGLPNKDRNVGEVLRDYTGDCGTKNECDATPLNVQLPGVNTPLGGTGTYCDKYHGGNNMVCKNGTKAGRAYETGGSDYLDDVAQALYEMDLRPDLGVTEKASTLLKNNLITYAVGFADPTLNASSVLSDAALLGGGRFYYAADAEALANALNSIISDISTYVGSSSSVATNSTQVGTNSLIYQGKFDSGGWYGDLIAYPIAADGSVGLSVWNGGANIPNDGVLTSGNYNASSNGRTILTYNPQASGSKGTTFLCDNLGAAQKAALGIVDCSSTTDQGVWRLSYLRGDKTHEVASGQRALQSGETETRSTDSSIALFRNRTRLDANSHASTPDPWLLGDIVNSNPVYVSNEDYLYNGLPEGQGTHGYAAFRSGSAYSGRRPMLYVGANDGMLHGFDASYGTSTAGREIVAYVPNVFYGQLQNLASPGYTHHYFVDGPPAVSDVYLSSASSSNKWRTVLVGTTGAGGQAVFALDITSPGASGGTSSGFGASNALWEISSSFAPRSTDLTSDTTSVRGFQNNLGYTLSEAAIVRMHDGSWAAVVANGYASTNNLAVLYIVDINTGYIIRALNSVNSDESSFTSANGLSAPFVADVNGDRIADYIYAGDLRGNLWKFDVTSATASSWHVANSGHPLYVACDQDMTLPCSETHRQPISSRPAVGLGGEDRPSNSYMVYFGTGKYYETEDNTSTQTQTFYGILDNSVVVPTAVTGATTRGTLVDQTTSDITSTDPNAPILRSTTSNACANDGWFTDLPDSGERVTEYPLIHGDRVIYTTLIPPSGSDSEAEAEDPCSGSGSSGGSGWLMEQSAVCGTPVDPTLPPWDINGDNKIDSDDLVTGGQSPSGYKSKVGIPTMPGIIQLPDTENGPKCEGGQCETKQISGSSGNIQGVLESFSPPHEPGRQSWYQVQ